MSWENSKILTPLKKDFLKSFFEVEDKFYLTGGSALGIFYLQHRFSYDLDFFTQQKIEWHIVDSETKSIAQSIGAECESLTLTPFFRRFKLTRGNESELVDFVIEPVAQIDATKNRFGSITVDTLNEIGINKMCMLLSRSELKDIIDLYFLEEAGFKIEDHLADAKLKEGGFDPVAISYLLATLKIDSLPAYLAKPLQIEQINAFIDSLRKRMAEISFPEKQVDL